MIYDIDDLPGEIWKDIPGYEDSHEASNMGRVKSKSRYSHNGKWLKAKIKKQTKIINDNYKYLTVSLCYDNTYKIAPVHRFIIYAFSGKLNEESVVIHLDGNTYNNRLDNLNEISRSDLMSGVYNGPKGQNIKYALMNAPRYLRPIIQLDLDDNVIAEFDSAIDVTSRFGFHNGNISKACSGKIKTAYGFKWRYKDDI